ncbi:MAG: PAS domain S-box protein [Deltaproteobacteria bacterium]|nr:PAS domain S-box protein [Deltaproteobacteria bacterium]
MNEKSPNTTDTDGGNPFHEEILRSVSDGIFLLDARGRLVLANEALARLMEGDPAAWTGRRAGAMLPKTKRTEGVLAFLAARSGTEKQLELQKRSRGGSIRDVLITLKPVSWQGTRHVLGIARDVTAVMEAGEAGEGGGTHRISLESILRAAPTGIALLRGRTFRWLSRQMAEMIGYNRTRLVGLEERRLYETQEEFERIGRLMAEGVRLNITVETDTRWRRRDGRIVDVHLRSTPLDPQRPEHGLIVSALDITDRKRNEEEIERRRKYLEAVLRDAPDAIITLDPAHRIIEWNPAAEEIFQYSREEASGENPDELITSEQSLEEARHLTRRVIGGRKVAPLETVRYRKDGSPVHVILSGSPILIGGRLQGIVAIYTDVSDRRAAESALYRSEERYRSLVENAPIGIVSIDRNGAIRSLNPTLLRLLAPEADPHGKNLFQMPPFDQPDVIESFHRSMERCTGGVFETAVEQDESTVAHIRYHVTPICDAEGRVTGAQSLVEDISESRRLELQLQQAQKLEAIGTLAGGVAHDFNNLLMGIQGRVSIMLLETKPSHPYYEQLKGIEDHTRSATELTRQLLGFVGGRSVETRPTDLNELVEKSVAMFGRTRKEIRIHTRLEGGLPFVEADPGRIEQVLLNLYVNSWQAMPSGGSLYLSTHTVNLEAAAARTFSLPPGPYVQISVRDTGVGMDEPTQQRIFDPFFTTKQKNRGTGLGLSSAYTIVSNHGGAIRVRSRKGEGAEFLIFLPASKSRANAASTASARPVHRGSETILLVDDEEMVLDVGRGLLQHLGYTVLLARSGEEAVRIYRERREEIDLVVLDMVMPGMGGGGTFDSLKEIDPGVRVLLSSGYSENGRGREIISRGCCGFIQKPFDIQTFSAKLREALSKHPRAS